VKEKGECCTFFAISSAGEIVTLFLYNIAGTSKMLALAGELRKRLFSVKDKNSCERKM
jgi:hypothetical protein